MGNPTDGQVIVYVPADKHAFTLDETAKLLALAKWPPVQNRRVSYPLRYNAPNTRGGVLTDDDEAVIAPIWKHAKMPEPTFPMPESDWANYMTAFNRSKVKPVWALGCCVEDDGYTHAILRAAAEEQFSAGLLDAIRAGSIAARDPLTGMPVSDVRVTVGTRDLLLSRADVERFAASAMIEVRMEPGKAAALANAERIEARCQVQIL